MQVTSDGSGLGSSWHLAEVEITDTVRNTTTVFPCEEWVEKETKTLFPRGVDGAKGAALQYEVTVFTSDIRGAGTDDNITLQLAGEQV